MAKKATITITLNNGVFTYSGAGDVSTISGKKHKVKSATSVEWKCDQDFGICFTDSPFQGGGTSFSAKGKQSIKPKAVANTGSFKYSVAVNIGGDEPILMEDPELDVSDDDTAP